MPPRNGPLGASAGETVWHWTQPSFVKSSWPALGSPLVLVAAVTTSSYFIDSMRLPEEAAACGRPLNACWAAVAMLGFLSVRAALTRSVYASDFVRAIARSRGTAQSGLDQAA